MAELEKEEACLLSGPTVNYSGATDISIDYLKTYVHMIHMDYFGLVLAVPPTLFFASFDKFKIAHSFPSCDLFYPNFP